MDKGRIAHSMSRDEPLSDKRTLQVLPGVEVEASQIAGPLGYRRHLVLQGEPLGVLRVTAIVAIA